VTRVSLYVNGEKTSRDIPDNTLLSTFLREHLNLKGTHIGCDTSQCGACVVIVNGKTVKSCTMLALQVAGSRVETVESLCDNGKLHPMQRAFHEHHALQCGFCTPGMLMTAVAFAKKGKEIDDLSVRTELEGNLCRCTGYQNIVAAILAGAQKMQTQK
tara:strand:- start:3433 stop:3906 length:474 start_codon:yes stop_codon:yes gene_type:complete